MKFMKKKISNQAILITALAIVLIVVVGYLYSNGKILEGVANNKKCTPGTYPNNCICPVNFKYDKTKNICVNIKPITMVARPIGSSTEEPVNNYSV
jgi:hypothetical protein